jgi:hypothetical protein
MMAAFSVPVQNFQDALSDGHPHVSVKACVPHAHCLN